MPECTQCGNYTKFENGLCITCYHKHNTILNIESGSLSEKEKRYRFNMIKGSIAETLIQELFLTLNYNVFRYGMENTIPGIIHLLRGVRSDVAEDIKRMPDFVVQNPKSGNVYFIEVKFRGDGEFNLNDLPKKLPIYQCLYYLSLEETYKMFNSERIDGRKSDYT